jgi:homoprotocatechuate degradation regulator HpaR
MTEERPKLPPYRQSLAGSLLAAREAVMSPIRPMLRTAEVTEQQWRVLRVLGDSGPMEPTALAAEALLYAPSVARILKELVERKLVVREPHPADRRRAILSLSADGRRLVRRTSDQTAEKLNEYMDLFGRERMAALLDELQAFTRAIGPAEMPGEESKGGRTPLALEREAPET